jgi:hypothetical protein
MTYATITTCTKDTELQDRVMAAASKEAWASLEFGATPYGERLRSYPEEALGSFMWPIAIDNEADYQYALDNGHEHPGSAEVITDAALQAGIQAHWPGTTPQPPQPDPQTGGAIWPASESKPLPTDMVGPTPGDPARVSSPHAEEEET